MNHFAVSLKHKILYINYENEVKVLVVQSCSTLFDPKEGSPPGSSIDGVLHTPVLRCPGSRSTASASPSYRREPTASEGRGHVRAQTPCMPRVESSSPDPHLSHQHRPLLPKVGGGQVGRPKPQLPCLENGYMTLT